MNRHTRNRHCWYWLHKQDHTMFPVNDKWEQSVRVFYNKKKMMKFTRRFKNNYRVTRFSVRHSKTQKYDERIVMAEYDIV